MSETPDDQTTYRDAGVDREAAEEAVSGYRASVESTRIPGVIDAVGGFGGLFSLQEAGLEAEAESETVLVGATDGVGTKLRIAFRMDRHDSIGIDCVAMCVNDVLTTGARPLFFLDYLSTGELDPGRAQSIVEGFAAGCRRAGCALLGGETAEMPGFYDPGEYDVAGFCVGALERGELLDGARAEDGDVLVGLASNGIHSNGFSLVRKVLRDNDIALDSVVSSVDAERTIGDVLLDPTLIYTEPVEQLRTQFDVRGLAHVTGGGLPENIPRALPEKFTFELDRDAWETPPIFEFLREAGSIAVDECYDVFNMGVGFVAVLPATEADSALDELDEAGWDADIIGSVRRA